MKAQWTATSSMNLGASIELIGEDPRIQMGGNLSSKPHIRSIVEMVEMSLGTASPTSESRTTSSHILCPWGNRINFSAIPCTMYRGNWTGPLVQRVFGFKHLWTFLWGNLGSCRFQYLCLKDIKPHWVHQRPQ